MKNSLHGKIEFSKMITDRNKGKVEEKKVGEMWLKMIMKSIDNNGHTYDENSIDLLIGFHNNEKILNINFKMTGVSVNWYPKNKVKENISQEELKEGLNSYVSEVMQNGIKRKNIFLDLKGNTVSSLVLSGEDSKYNEFADINEVYLIQSSSKDHYIRVAISYNFILITILEIKEVISIFKSNLEEDFSIFVCGMINPWDFYNPNGIESEVTLIDIFNKFIHKSKKILGGN